MKASSTRQMSSRNTFITPMDRKTFITAVAVVLVAASLPVTWGIADVRKAQTVEEKKTDMQQTVVNQRHAPSDYDDDGVDDSDDACPRRPETQNGFEDDDGCPDIVTTTGAS